MKLIDARDAYDILKWAKTEYDDCVGLWVNFYKTGRVPVYLDDIVVSVLREVSHAPRIIPLPNSFIDTLQEIFGPPFTNARSRHHVRLSVTQTPIIALNHEPHGDDPLGLTEGMLERYQIGEGTKRLYSEYGIVATCGDFGLRESNYHMW
jgi:hypothetical protein